MTITTIGKLKPIGVRRLGLAQFEYFECVDCGAQFPRGATNRGNVVTCNGHIIDLCPWCRPDSKAWEKGRGK